jgi:hypothetical protein
MSQRTLRTGLPFSSLIGLGRAKRALMCAAVDDTIKGVLIKGPPGTAKSVLVRSFADSISACCTFCYRLGSYLFGAFIGFGDTLTASQVGLGCCDHRVLGDLTALSGLVCAHERIRLFVASHCGDDRGIVNIFELTHGLYESAYRFSIAACGCTDYGISVL